MTKGALLTALSSFGLDISEILTGIDLAVRLDFILNPINIELNITLGEDDGTGQGLNVGLKLHSPTLVPDSRLEMPDWEAEGYKLIESLQRIRISLDGYFHLGVLGSEEGEDFDFIMQRIRDRLNSTPGGSLIDLDKMLSFGLLLKVIGGRFGGTIFYSIDAVIDLADLNNLNLSLRLSSEDAYMRYKNDNDPSGLGNILGIYVISENGKLNLYFDGSGLRAENSEGELLFSIGKIKITDLSAFIASFSASGNTPIEPSRKTTRAYLTG